MILRDEGGELHPPKTKVAMGKQPFEDVSPIRKKCDCLFVMRYLKMWILSDNFIYTDIPIYISNLMMRLNNKKERQTDQHESMNHG